MKKVIYILGAARSGSTLLDVLLGNAADAFSGGEMMKFPQLRGIPHGAPHDSATYAFWSRVGEGVQAKTGMDYAALEALVDRFELHGAFVHNLFSLHSASLTEKYRHYINLLFDMVCQLSGKNIVIDSSKRPSRALALRNFLHYELYIIYLVRNPVDVIRSMTNRQVAQDSKGWLSANLYYFLVNACSNILKTRIPETNFLTIFYENLLSDPIQQLRRVEDRFRIDLSPVKEKVESNLPLEVGYLFDGNRIRLQKSLVLDRRTPPNSRQPHELFTSSINKLWWNEKQQRLSQEACPRVR
jgi:hypothetical protein